jgi:phosphohistidine phosphatase
MPRYVGRAIQLDFWKTPKVRRLVIVRHAKAKSDSPRGDHGRELSQRGRLQSLVLRSWTEPGGPLADIAGTVVVSDAARTLETFALGLAGTAVCRRAVVEPSLYNGFRHVSTTDVLEALGLAGDGDGDLVVVGHNPTVLDVTADLATDPEHAAHVLRDGFPLCAAAVLTFEGPSPRERGCELVALFTATEP